MKLIVYKGFNEEFLSKVNEEPLVNSDIAVKLDVLKFDKKTRKQLDMALLSMEESDEAWVTYSEFTLIKNRIDDAIEEDGLELVIFTNNLYPDYYPLPFTLSGELVTEIEKNLNSNIIEDCSEECKRYFAIYNNLVDVDGIYYGSFYNYEYEEINDIDIIPYYMNQTVIEDVQIKPDIDIFVNEDVNTYLKDLTRIIAVKPSVIGLKTTNGLVSKRIVLSLKAYCVANGIRLVKFHEQLEDNVQMEQELIDIAKNDVHIVNFTGFRTIKFYKNPDINKEIVELSQSTLIQEIIYQAENSYNKKNRRSFRDIFITASTGAGKSIMFQIPAIYLAKHYNKLTIIIEPVKALMQDQKEKLVKNGYTRVATFNSDLISQVEKEAVLNRIKAGEVDLLYLSPETLLSYSIDTIIGDREIGLLIINEAHIVTTWGMGFRPDYWYLGEYINRLRNQIQTTSGKTRKTYNFPICAFTATAINGGTDDSVSDTIISLNMQNPVKFIGYARRDDIEFDIRICEIGKLPNSDYELKKTQVMSSRITKWLEGKEKTIVYFPYAQNAFDASRGVKGFVGIKIDPRIGVFTGKNVDELSTEMFNEKKRETFDKFRKGEQLIIYATKAFGMGVDIDDVQNVYHYAVSGNLCDYIQEIGRAARKPGMTGVAETDFFFNDMIYMNKLFGMSQIKQYQIKKVLEGIYNVYKSKKGSRNFLISPQSFTYIFNGKGLKDEGQCINKLKTCLLMLEKDLYDKYTFKVIISRPQSVFTKAYVVINKQYESLVLNSEYGKCFKFLANGKHNEIQPDGSLLSDTGDVYTLDLKQVWENFYSNISFPQFKYWYFNGASTVKDKVAIMPSIREFFAPRQKVNIETHGDLLLNEIREKILDDFEYIANTLYAEFGKHYFTTDDFIRVIREKYGMTQARIISNSLFDLVDPNMKCVKRRNSDNSSKNYYMLSNGNFKEFMRKAIIKSEIVNKITMSSETSYSSYMSISNDECSNIALKLLSIFDYISYEILGGEEPEIFIRLNDPQKVKNIALGNVYYSNDYVTKAKKKHDRDVKVLIEFFTKLNTNKERWDYIENYFLGKDVLYKSDEVIEQVGTVEMTKSIDKEKSHPTHQYKKWDDLDMFFDQNDHVIIDKIAESGVVIPEYLSTVLKKSDFGDNILMSWPSKNVLICQQDTEDYILSDFKKKGWTAYRIYEVDLNEIKEILK